MVGVLLAVTFAGAVGVLAGVLWQRSESSARLASNELDPRAAASFIEENMPAPYASPAACPAGVPLKRGQQFECEAEPGGLGVAKLVLRVESQLGRIRLLRIVRWPAQVECPAYLPCP